MATFKCVAFWSCRQRGWSEVYYVDSVKAQVSDSLDAVKSFLTSLMMTKRVKLAGKQAEFFAFRISRITNPKGSQLYNDELPQPPGFGSGNGGYDTDNPPSTLVVTMANVDQSKKRQMHLRGIPDTIDQLGGKLITNTTPGFDAAFTDWAEWMANPAHGMVWRGSTDSLTFDVFSYVAVPETGAVEFTFVGTPFVGLPPGRKVTVRISDLNYKNSELNGQLTMKVLTNNSAVTIRPYAVFPYFNGGKMRFNTMGNIDIRTCRKVKIGSRDTGPPPLQPVGRGKARIHG